MLNLHHVKAYIFYFIIFFGLNAGKIISADKQSEIQRKNLEQWSSTTYFTKFSGKFSSKFTVTGSGESIVNQHSVCSNLYYLC